jgi:hypothetical protein
MTPADMLPHLERWAAVQRHAESTWDRLESIHGYTDSESPLGKAVWDTFDAYTLTLSALIGDTGEWLDWFHLANDMGAKSLAVTLRPGARPRNIRTLRQLATIIHLTSAP